MWLSILNYFIINIQNLKKKTKNIITNMGIEHSKNQYSFSDHYYVI
jgi:hypothetical protein